MWWKIHLREMCPDTEDTCHHFGRRGHVKSTCRNVKREKRYKMRQLLTQAMKEQDEEDVSEKDEEEEVQDEYFEVCDESLQRKWYELNVLEQNYN